MPPKPPGTLIAGRYEVRRFLGSGSFGEVHEVRDHHQDKIVALKFLRQVSGAATWAEAQILTQLQSPYVLPVFNADFDSGVPFLVTELAAGGSTDRKMRPLGVPIDQAVRWVRAACRGAARAHTAGLLHRDIKSENVFLRDERHALLGDFGITILMNANGEAPCAGTPETMAPEVAAGGNTSVTSDVYSLGATLYALLAGRYAHNGPNPQACMASVVVAPAPPIRDLAPHVTQALAQRVSRAMARDPADRYSNPAEFDAALGDLPAAVRQWRRTDEHPGHAACWRGEATGKSDATVCLIPAGRRWEVAACHQPSGRRITPACRPPGPQSALPRNLRAAMASVP
jgi:eukaryotic-like serine/threonine-protein kinase